MGTNGVVSGEKGIYYTTTGGNGPASWTRFNISGNTTDSLLYNNIQFRHAFSINSASSNNLVWACGKDTVNNVAVIMKFNLPAMTYSWIYTGAPNSGLNNIGYNTNNSKFYAVGDDGLVVNFTQSTTATQLPNTLTQDLSAINFLGNKFACGTTDYQIYGTDNGTTLQFTTLQAPGMIFKDVHYQNTAFFSYTGTAFHRSNSGILTNYTAFDFGPLKGQGMSNYLTNYYIGTDHGIFKQVNSNYLLEWQPSSGTYSIKDFWYDNAATTNFYACGKNGTVLLTSNAGGPTKPYATIAANGTCAGPGTIYTGGNPGSGTSCSWTVNGAPVSGTCSSFGYSTVNPGAYALTYVSNNGSFSDTAYATLHIVTPPQSNLPFVVTDTILCHSEPLEITIQNTESNVYYSLFKYGSGTNLGSSVAGNGGSLTFTTTSIGTPGNYYIRATSTLANCYRNFTDTIHILVEKTNADFHVGLINAEVNENVPFHEQTWDAQNFSWTFTNQGNTTTSSLPNPVIPFSLQGTTDVKLVCWSNAGCYDSIQKAGPRIISTVGINDSCWTNQNRGVDLSWNGYYKPDIGDLLLTKDGYYTVGQFSSVTFESRYGDSLTNALAGSYINKYDRNGVLKWTVYAQLPLSQMNLLNSRHGFLKIKEDSERNIVVIGSSANLIDNAGDTIAMTPIFNNYILKLDSLGHYLWHASSTYFGPQAVGIDQDDNILLGGWRNSQNINPSSPQDFFLSGVVSDTLAFSNIVTNYGVIKLSPQGNILFEMPMNFNASNKAEILNIGTDYQNNFYLSGNLEFGINLFNVNSTVGNYFDAPGNSYTSKPFVLKYTPAGQLIWKSLGYSNTNATYGLYSRESVTTLEGHTYITGRNVFQAGALSIVYQNPDSSTVTQSGGNYYVMKVNQNGYCEWINSMVSTSSMRGEGDEILVEGSEVHVLTYLLGNIPSAFTFTDHFGSQITLPGAEENFCVNVYDTTGLFKRSILNNPTPSNPSSMNGYNGLYRDTAGFYYTSRNIHTINSSPYTEFGYTLQPTLTIDGWATRFHEECGYVYHPSYNFATTVDVCHGGNITLSSGLQLTNVTADTIITFTGLSAFGMDSIVVTTVHVLPTIVTQHTETICYGSDYTFPDGTTQTAIHAQTVHSSFFQTPAGCDSTVITTLMINADTLQNHTVEVCYNGAYTFPDGSSIANITQQIIHASHLQSSVGCDSTVITTLTINGDTLQNQSVVVCYNGAYTFPDGTSISNITQQVIHESNLQSSVGCDSTVITTLTINGDTLQNQTVEVCYNGSYTFPDGTSISNITQQVIHESYLQSSVGCDSTVITTLTINADTLDTETVEVCYDGMYTFPDGTSISNITQQTIHESHLQTTSGCDSTVVTTVDVLAPYSASETITVCLQGAYTYPDGTTATNIVAQQIHISNLTSIFGCDSIITTTVNPQTFDTSVNYAGGILSSNDTQASYQWLDCINSFNPISGATSAVFAPTLNGSYAVELSLNGCTAQSSCIAVDDLSLSEFANPQSVSIYPNPSTGQFTVHFGSVVSHTRIVVRDLSGRSMYDAYFIDTDKILLQLNVSDGYYILETTSENSTKQEFKIEIVN
jgi:hypothetical protein